ncbi:MAG: DUF1801 domain-containing protein, partial [Myxococcota bacterium]
VRPPPSALQQFLAPYGPAITRLYLATRAAVLGAAPDATELIYDAYNTVSIADTFSDRLKEAFCHVAAYSDYVNLGFSRGAALDDPDGLLVGSGASIRHLRIEAAPDIARPAVQHLLRAAVAEGRALGPTPPRTAVSVVQSVSPKKRRPV